ncbi:2416_t:CDS:2 [Ambispora leptoticha]|uniref:2416_t:CDS:1 n=1 Tax=Ambispora leptoticha TaxID=144679 RepID=A0A9N8VZI8_9GLOM|nr:2416_t:CDS:2 [Ambispora leptoticha]
MMDDFISMVVDAPTPSAQITGGLHIGFGLAEKLSVSLPNYIETAIEVGKVVNHAVIAVLTGNIAFLVDDIVKFASAAKHCKAECKRLGEQMKIARDSAKDLLDKLDMNPKEIEDKSFVTALKAFAIVLEDGRAVVKQHAEAKYGLKIFHAKKFAAEFQDIEERLDQACTRLNLALNIRRYVDSQEWEETHRTWHEEDKVAFERLNTLVKESLEEIKSDKRLKASAIEILNETSIVPTVFTDWKQFKTDRVFTATYHTVDEHKNPLAVKTIVKVTRAKESDPSEMRSFALEVTYLKKLAPCPNIIKLIGTTVKRGVMALVIEYCEKGDLQSLIAAGDLKGDWGKKRSIALGVAQGVAYLHEAGIFHKYINSGNILIDNHYQPKLTNFRKSRWITGITRREVDSFEEQIRWTAPERLGDDVSAYTAACDVYSFGIVYYEIVTEKFPWQGLQLDAVYNIRKVEGKELLLDPIIPPAISTVFTNCIHHNPLQRFTTKEIIAHLEAIRPEELEMNIFKSEPLPGLEIMEDEKSNYLSPKLYASLSLSDVSDDDESPRDILENGETHNRVREWVKARKEYEKVEETFPQACFRLGEYYYYGRGVTQDYDKAFEYLGRARDKGNGDAIDMLGYIYLTGKGGPKDRHKAVKFFRDATEKEIPFAFYHLGVCYFRGWGGLTKDEEQAKKLIFKAARMGNEDAQKFAHSQKWDVQQVMTAGDGDVV